MREIKFRAWDSEEERFIYSDQNYDSHWFQFDDLKTLKAFGLSEKDYGPPEERVESRELEEVQQHTGLKDRDGGEIYEGDIIEEGGNTAVVEWHNEQARFCYKTKTGSAGMYLFAGKVVGNIYESNEAPNAPRPARS